MISTERLTISPATNNDINIILEIEHHKENKDFIWQGTYKEHSDEIENPNAMLLLFKKNESDKLVGYALIYLDHHSNKFELRRIAITEKGNGFGYEIMKALIKYAFEETDTNRFWLDVYPHNLVGVNLYEKLGLHRDGILRENYKSDRGYLDMIVYSLLRSEYREQR